MNNNKAQMSGSAWAIIGAVLAVIVIAIILNVGLLTTSSVKNSLTYDKIETVWNNEQITTNVKFTDQTNHSTLLNHTPVKANSQTVVNASSSALTENTDYTLVDSTGNFTLINAKYNNTILNVTYTQLTDSAFELASDEVDSTTSKSFELSSTGLTILASVAILTVVVGIIYVFRGSA